MTFTEFDSKWRDIEETADPEYAALLEELREDIDRVKRSKTVIL